MKEKEKTVITGVGMVTALGNNVEETWKNLVKGKCGIGEITLFDPQGLETRIAAQVSDSFEQNLKGVIRKRDGSKMTRVTRMGMLAADEAVKDSGLEFENCDRTRVAVIMGIVTSAYNDMERKASDASIIVKSMPNALSAWISLKYGLLGPNFNVSTACASGTYAIALAKQMLEADMADIVLAGGADSHINRECIYGFNQILALSTQNEEPAKACRPFSAERDGFVMGEGAGVLVLEKETHARRRGADIYASLEGTAITSEAADITAPKKDGAGMEDTMRRALLNAGVEPEEIDYINAHGTSTNLNDKYETLAIKRLFGKRAGEISISSTKSMLGHTIGAAGAIESIVTALSIKNGIITPTVNYETPDPILDLDYTPNEARTRSIRTAISNSFGFGGHHGTVVLKAYQ